MRALPSAVNEDFTTNLRNGEIQTVLKLSHREEGETKPICFAICHGWPRRSMDNLFTQFIATPEKSQNGIPLNLGSVEL